MNRDEQVRPASVAGAFYPGGAAPLAKSVRELVDAARVDPIEGEIVAAAAPHAGYVYSGRVAGHTYRALSGVSFDTVVVIGHDSYRGAVAYVSPASSFRTPLGDVPVDREMVEKLLKANPGIVASAAMHAGDHTVEVQLPFLQSLGRPFRIVPILFGDPTLQNAGALADAILAASGDRKVFVLASTDMSHYPPYEAATVLDNETLDVLRSADPRRLFEHLAKVEGAGRVPNLRTALCARGGVGTALYFAKARGASRVQVLRYANSGDAPVGDKAGVVGYFAAVFTRSPSAQSLADRPSAKSDQ